MAKKTKRGPKVPYTAREKRLMREQDQVKCERDKYRQAAIEIAGDWRHKYDTLKKLNKKCSNVRALVACGAERGGWSLLKFVDGLQADITAALNLKG